MTEPVSLSLWCHPINHCQIQSFEGFALYLPFKSFLVLDLIFRSLIHFELIFVYGIR